MINQYMEEFHQDVVVGWIHLDTPLKLRDVVVHPYFIL